ncbi:hypothetical protein PSTG_11922 [Puccinia striiformis f. sp. tritici PST-78]|uniref:Uncharacterized protein n=1 Tax=Puccinia striiformis f. sp. tritici PST-78 TaxID=1165861 RepID=A0A0L0V6V1_9BASI|nr:hypothetical protein PSTG_11922 [Puccinia striiformis f. sp. tritici PST-78]
MGVVGVKSADSSLMTGLHWASRLNGQYNWSLSRVAPELDDQDVPAIKLGVILAQWPVTGPEAVSQDVPTLNGQHIVAIDLGGNSDTGDQAKRSPSSMATMCWPLRLGTSRPDGQ